MQELPKLRPVEAFPVQQDGKTIIYLKDPMNFATPLAVSPAGYFVAAHLDGRHSLIEIQEAYAKRFGAVLPNEELRKFIAMLDANYYLGSDRFVNYQNARIVEFRRAATRVPAHAGGVYAVEAVALKQQLDGYFTDPEGPGMPSYRRALSAPKAIVSPHIDFHRGGQSYAWSYLQLAESEGADLFILLGTSHCSGRNPFILTRKDFETPLGTVKTDQPFVDALQAHCPEDLFADEYLHRGEHSLEFQVVFLKYVAQRRAEITGAPESDFRIVPILVSSFHPMILGQRLPEESSAVANFLSALRALIGQERRRVCFVAGVDLAHVGRQFGDPEPITEDFLRWVEAEDALLIERLASLDAAGFFGEVAKDQDKRKICGFSPLYSLIHLLDGARAKTLKYRQAFTPETASAVTFTSMIFE